MQLSSYPLVTALARWIWAVDKDNNDSNDEYGDVGFTPELCLHQIESQAVTAFVASGCLGQAASKILGVGIVGASMFNKAPTLMNMMETQSAEGFSPMGMYTEVMYYANSSIYSIQLGYPFTAVSIPKRWDRSSESTNYNGIDNSKYCTQPAYSYLYFSI
jgi:hypothetical protein